MKRISISDITLKKFSQEREVSLLFREKTAITSCADLICVDAVELAPVKNIREDKIVYKTIAQNTQCTVTLPVGFSQEDIDNAWECIKDAKNPRLQVEAPVSTVQMEYICHMKSDKMLEKIDELVSYAKTLCSDVEFSALDATRADEDFLLKAIKVAENKGANIITICDDAGVSLPGEIADIVKKVKNSVNIPVFVQVSNQLGMAVASAVSAIESGVDGLKCSMVSGKELSMGEISDVFSVRGETIGAVTGLKNTKIHASIDDLLENINHQSYENEVVISEKKKILLDGDSSISQVSQASEVLGYNLSDEDLGKVYKALMQVCEKKGSVGSKELEAVIASYAMQAPSTYHLESYTTSCGNIISSMSQVVLKRDDETICGVSVGDGPIDSVFRAIEQCIGYHYELDDFQVQSITEGKEALGSAIVRLRDNGKLYSGTGTSTDIVAASIRAYINALNKIVYEEE